MAIENSVSNAFWSAFVDSINVFNCRLSDVLLHENIAVKSRKFEILKTKGLISNYQ